MVKVGVFAIVCVVALLHNPVAAADKNVKIPAVKCCPGYYNILTDQCQESEEEGHPVAESAWPPAVRSVHENRTLTRGIEDFQLNYTLRACAEGYVARVAVDFIFRDDGSLMTSSGPFQPGQFCLDQVMPYGEEAQFLARFCLADPCAERHCIRKCCPLGMAINGNERICQFYSKDFVVVVQHENGSVVDVGDMLILDGGTAPRCHNEISVLRPDIYGDGDQFFILPNGQLKVPLYTYEESVIKDYCIDSFFYDNFSESAMVCFPEQPEDPWNMLIYRYFLIVSSLFLILTFIVYAVLPEIRNIHGVTIMCHVASKAVMYITFALIQLNVGVYDDPVSHRICITLAVTSHFTWLASFTWLNVMSFDIWWTFSDLKPRSLRHHNRRHHLGFRFLMYSLYAWGVPTLIVSVGQILDNVANVPENIIKPDFGVYSCWFGDASAQMAYLYGPIALIILSNIVFFVLTALQLYRVSVDAAFATNKAHAKQKFRVIFSLFVLMGISWMMEIVSFAADGETGDYIWIPTDILNIMTGVYIFVIFVCKKKVWKLLKQRWVLLDKIERRVTRGQHVTITRRATQETSTSGMSKSMPNTIDSFPNKRNIRHTQSTNFGDSTQVDSADERPDSRLTGKL